MRLNVGCGQTPTSGWINLDNSPSIWLARFPLLARIGIALGLIGQDQASFIEFAHHNRIAWVDAAGRLPYADGSADVVYACHMVEHLDRREAESFLREALRVLEPRGILRLVVPDLRTLVDRYLRSGDGDAFVAETLLTVPRPEGLRDRVQALVVGGRQHRWLYDASSLCNLLRACGFADAKEQPPGATRIRDPGPLDLREREDESLYVEAVKPES